MVDQGNITTPNAADLNAAARMYCKVQGWSLPDGGYPIRPANNHGEADLTSAIRAVGRGGASHDAIRRHIIKRANAIGLHDQLPDNWTAKGALTDAGQARSAERQTMYRTYEPDIEIRSGGDGRTVHGILVPFDTPYFINDDIGYESFDRAAFDHQLRGMYRVPFYGKEHKRAGGVLVGRLNENRPDAAGLYGAIHVDKTRDGDETLEMIRSGTLPHFSVGFYVRPNGTEVRTQGMSRVQHRTKADMTEVAAVPLGAYGEDAAIAGVRSMFGDLGTPNLDKIKQLAQGLPVLKTG